MTPTEGTAKPKLEPFPVQVGTIVPVRIDFEAFVRPDQAKAPQYHNPAKFEARVNVKYHVEETTGMVMVFAEAGFGEEGDREGVSEAKPVIANPPYRLSVGVAAPFVYKPENVTKAEVIEWCEKGAFFVVSPYLRLLIFEVTAHSGFPLINLPLVTVPIFREKPRNP